MRASRSWRAGSRPKHVGRGARRDSQKASNTASGACRRSSAACTQQRQVARQAARLRFVGDAVDPRRAAASAQAVERGVRAARRRQFLLERRRPRRPPRSARSRSSAMMLPAPSQIELTRHLAVDARHHALAVLLDVAVAAQAFHRLLREVAAALADPELGDRRQHAAHHLLRAHRRRARCGRPHAPGAARARWRLRSPAPGRRARSSSAAARSARLPKAWRCAVWCSASDSAWRIRPAVPSAQSSRVSAPIARICGTPRPSSPTSQAAARVELDLGAGVGLVAELVLQALDARSR